MTDEVQVSRERPRKSPRAAMFLQELMEHQEVGLHDDAMGATDCPEGCVVEPDGECPHGFESACLTLGVI